MEKWHMELCIQDAIIADAELTERQKGICLHMYGAMKRAFGCSDGPLDPVKCCDPDRPGLNRTFEYGREDFPDTKIDPETFHNAMIAINESDFFWLTSSDVPPYTFAVGLRIWETLKNAPLLVEEIES